MEQYQQSIKVVIPAPIERKLNDNTILNLANITDLD